MKKIIFVVCAVLVSLFVFGCTTEANGDSRSCLKMYHEDGYVCTVKDSETGVNYIVICCGGQDNAICPRYNADGTLYTD